MSQPRSRRSSAGQLVMSAFQAGGVPSSMRSSVQGGHVDNVLYLGGRVGSVDQIGADSAALEELATRGATGGVGLLVAADQEGVNVQQRCQPRPGPRRRRGARGPRPGQRPGRHVGPGV